jgi:hypothetical protein
MMRNWKTALTSKWLCVAAFVAAFAIPSLASAAVDTGVSTAFTGTGQSILDNVTAVLPDVLIPFAVLLAISIIVRLYHKVRG